MLTDNCRLMNQPLILASGSPRRRELLEQADFVFQVIAPPEAVERGVSRDQGPLTFVVDAAFKKAQAVAAKVDRGIVLAADTIAQCDGQILGKPSNRNHAEQILRTMMGKKHFVHTGVCLWHCPSNDSVTHVESSQLVMSVMPEHELQTYLDSNKWIGKAGAFGYQDGIDWVKLVDGLESNVVGLPVERLNDWIQELINRVD